MPSKQNKQGCGCFNVIFLIALLGVSYAGLKSFNPRQFFPEETSEIVPIFTPPSPSPTPEVPLFSYPQTVPKEMVIHLEGLDDIDPINQAFKRGFQQSFLGTTVNLNSQGGETSLQNLWAGKTDIAIISRPLTESETKQGLVAIPIHQEAIAFMVGVDNPYRRGITKDQVLDILRGKINNWSTLGGENKPIKVFSYPPKSRIQKHLQELVLNGGNLGNFPSLKIVNSEAIDPIIKNLGTDGISYGLYHQVKDQLLVRVVPIDGLIPDSPFYPYQKTIFYVYKFPPSPQVKAFLGYALSPQGQQIKETAHRQIDPPPVVEKIPPKIVPKTSMNDSLKATTAWEKKALRGIYISRYQITNNASEETIRARVRYYKEQGINTIIHGVWGNGCTMYNSEVMQQTLGFRSCPNQFNEQWLNWLIDEAHQQGMQVHAYFEKGIKIDKNSPIFELAKTRNWLVPGVDKTYGGIDHYVLDVEVPEIANFFTNILVEFVQKYPQIDAVQWDDYLGYYAELPSQGDRTLKLTNFVKKMTTAMKKANPSVSFDLSHHNPYWAKRYFAADWQNWQVDRVFIQAYAEPNFKEELNYAQSYAGIAITDQQLHRLSALINNPKINSILIFPLGGNPEKTATDVKTLTK